MKKHAAPIIAALLLLLPMLYVASYLALVLPQSRWANLQHGIFMHSGEKMHYRYPARVGRSELEWTEIVFWPLEQIDRKVRPEAWESKQTRIRRLLEELP